MHKYEKRAREAIAARKKEELDKKREYERQKKFEEKVRAKIEAMSPKEKNEHLSNLIDQMSIIEAQIKDQQANLREATNAMYYKDPDHGERFISIMLGTMGAVLGACIGGLTKGFDGGLVGSFVGFLSGASFMGIVDFVIHPRIKNERVFNAVKKFKVMVANKKTAKLKDSKLKLAKEIDILKEKDLTGKNPHLTDGKDIPSLNANNAEMGMSL